MKTLILPLLIIMLALMNNCKMQNGAACPTFSGGKAIKHHHNFTLAAHKPVKTKKTKNNVTPTHAQKFEMPEQIYSTAANDGIGKIQPAKLINVELPAEYKDKVEAMGRDKINNELSKHDKNTKIATKGDKVYLQTTFKGMAKTAIKFSKPAALDGGADWDLIALLSGIFGIVAIVFSLAPCLNLLGFLMAIAAVVMGALALNRSGSRRTWALVGIMLGAIALFFCLVFFFLYYSVFAIIF